MPRAQWQKGLPVERDQGRHPERWPIQWASGDTVQGNAKRWDPWARKEHQQRLGLFRKQLQLGRAWGIVGHKSAENLTYQVEVWITCTCDSHPIHFHDQEIRPRAFYLRTTKRGEPTLRFGG